MAEGDPRLFADERGVWREDEPGQAHGVEWDEIAAVGGYKLDLKTQTCTLVELDLEGGEWIEMLSTWQGFEDVVRVIGVRLPGIRPTWFEEINALCVGDRAVTVWRRLG